MNRDNMRMVRLSETEEEKEQRMTVDRDNTRVVRLSETMEEKEQRTTVNRDNMRTVRLSETDLQKEQRRTADRNNKKRETEATKNNFLAASRDVTPFSVGLMNQICSKCDALMFAEETHKGRLGEDGKKGMASFSMCCR